MATAPRVIWAVPVVPAPPPRQSPGNTEFATPLHRSRGGANCPEPHRAKRHHSAVVGRGTPFKPVTALERANAREGQPARRRRKGATGTLACWCGAWGPVAVAGSPATGGSDVNVSHLDHVVLPGSAIWTRRLLFGSWLLRSGDKSWGPTVAGCCCATLPPREDRDDVPGQP